MKLLAHLSKLFGEIHTIVEVRPVIRLLQERRTALISAITTGQIDVRNA